MTDPATASAALNLPLPGLLAAIGVTYLATLVVSRMALHLKVPSILSILILGVMLSPAQQLLSVESAEALHTVTLAMLLFVAGLNSDADHIRGFLGYGVLLAIGGVIISSLILGVLIWSVCFVLANSLGLGISLPLGVSLLIAACLGSTDSGATLSVLKSIKDRIPQRIRLLIEFESSVNDPAAILFLFLVINLAGSESNSAIALLDQLQEFIKSIGNGILVGLIITYLAQYCLNHLITSKDQILVMGISIALASYGFSMLLGGSGFISAYVTGLFLANNIYDNKLITPELLENSLEPFNTTMQVTVFLLFGMLINPLKLPAALPAGVLIAAGLMLIARPLSVMLFQRWSPFNIRGGLLISWCGLRGAVPIALGYTAIMALPEMPNISMSDQAAMTNMMLGLIFIVVFINLTLQGLTLPWVCRKLEVSSAGQT